MSVNPRRILRLPAIRIAEGEKANLTLLDPDIEWIVSTDSFLSKSKNSPFDKMKLKGRAIGVINNNSAYFINSNAA
jgi:dihydroorotase